MGNCLGNCRQEARKHTPEGDPLQEQTVGERRYWNAYVAGIQINRAVRVPYESKAEQGDIFTIEGKQYEVVQKDLKDDKLPPSWLLSLASAQIEYKEKKDE